MILHKKKSKVLKPFFVIDVETRGLSARPESFIFGCVYGHNFRKTFFDVTEFRKWLISKRNKGKIFFAHNSEYDYSTIFGNIITQLDNEAIFVGSTFICAKCNGVKFFNSLAILKSSVKELGKNLGLEKMELANKFKAASKSIKVTQQDIEYCFRDCEIVYTYLHKIFLLTGTIKPTIASCSMEIFTTNFLKKKIFIHPLNENFRNSYYGGRVECFQIGKTKAKKYDVNSIYPFVCTKMYFPNFENLRFKKTCPIFKFKKLLDTHEGQAEIKVAHINSFVGGLPYKRNDEIIFPYGTFSGTWNFNEIRAALKYKLIKIKSVKNITYGSRVFFSSLSDFMKHFYKLKNNSTGAEKLINKFILNSLTGKFAEKEHDKMIYFKCFEDFLKDEHKYKNKNLSFHHFGKGREDFFISFSQNTVHKIWLIPTISSYITSEARSYMLKYYLEYKENLIYTDTDSLALTCSMNKEIISETTIGMFKEEKEIVTEILGNKHYITNTNGKKYLYLKGVPKEHIRKRDFFSYNKMIKTREGLRHGRETGMFVEVIKRLDKNYTKREVNKNGTTKQIKL
jgi:hypothetical protein